MGFVSNYIDYDYKITTDVVAGMTYFVRVRARNFWGWSEYSDLLEIKASTWPSKVNTPLTVLDESSGDILL